MDILQRSASQSGSALNIIFAIVDTNDENFYKTSGKHVNTAIEVINKYPLHSLREIMHGFSNDVILYTDILKNSRLSGESLTSTIWSMLKTDPTVLVEVNVLSPDHYVLYVSHWGGTFEPDGTFISPIRRLTPLNIDLRSIPPDSGAQRVVALTLALSSVLVSMGDAYRMLHRTHDLPKPIFPTLMTNTSSATLPDVWKPMTKAYLSTYDSVAAHSPVIASELAAQAALAAHANNHADFASALLDKALQVHPLLRGAPPDKDAIRPILLRQRMRGREPSELENAMIALRGLTIEKVSSTQNADDRVRAFRPKDS